MAKQINSTKYLLACCIFCIIFYLFISNKVSDGHNSPPGQDHLGTLLSRGVGRVILMGDTNSQNNVWDDSWIESTSTDQRLMVLEKVIFAQNSYIKTVHNDTQLFYADSVKMVTQYRISKQDFCNKYQNLKTILFVWSRVSDLDQRSAIRRTWAKPLNGSHTAIKVLFVLGSTDNEEVQRRVFKEDKRYGDILQFQFLDSYHNCTLKSIGVLRWTEFFCQNAKYVMKIDDDFLVNTDKLLEFMDNKTSAKLQIFGTKGTGYQPHRDPLSKWHVNAKSYPDEYYPDFIFGPHIMTSDCVSILYDKCLKTLPALWLEDVYITGILADNTHIERVDEKLFVRLDRMGKDLDEAINLFNESLCLGHNFKSRIMYQVWDQLRDAQLVAK